MRRGKKAVLGILLGALVGIFALPGVSFADAANAYLNVSPAKQGETTTVTATYSGPNLGHVNGSLSYDTSVLKYVGGNDNDPEEGVVWFNTSGSGEDLSVNFEFEAIAGGDTRVILVTGDVFNLDEQAMDTPQDQGATVSVEGSSAPTDSDQNKEEDAKKQDGDQDDSGEEAQNGEDSNAGQQTLISEKDKEETEKADSQERGSHTVLVVSILALIVAAGLAAVLVRNRRKGAK